MKILPRPVAADRAGISVSTLKRLESADDFPARFAVTPGRVGELEIIALEASARAEIQLPGIWGTVGVQREAELLG